MPGFPPAGRMAGPREVYFPIMRLRVDIEAYGGDPLPQGSVARVELRDTSFEDAPAILLHKATAIVPVKGSTTTLSVALDIDAVPDGTTVWVHVDVDNDGRVSKGDYVSTQSYSLTGPAFSGLQVQVKKVA